MQMLLALGHDELPANWSHTAGKAGGCKLPPGNCILRNSADLKTDHGPIAVTILHRWCVTGTPVGTDIADLKGQFSFLRLHPFTNKNFFSMYVKSAYAGSAWARAPADKLLYILGQCMIRHTKLQVRHMVPRHSIGVGVVQIP